MVVVVDDDDAEAATKFLVAQGETVYRIAIEARKSGEPRTVID